MKKKRIMCGLIVFNVIIMLVYGLLCFMNFPSEKINNGKRLVSIDQTELTDRDTIADALCNASEKLKIDIALEYITENYTIDYFRTTNDSSFFDISTEEGLPVSEDKIFSSHPENDEVKIYGFFIKSTDFRILPFNELRSRNDIDLSLSKYLVNEADLETLTAELEQNGIIVSSEVGTTVSKDMAQYKLLIGMFILFMVIAEVFYVFSRSKEYGIRRSMGFSSMNILADELKDSIFQLFIIPLAVILIAFIALSAVFGIASAAAFMKFTFISLALLLCGGAAAFSLSVIILALRCGAAHIKGYSKNKELFTSTIVFKSIVIVLTAFSLTSLLSSAVTAYKTYRTTKSSVKSIEDYSATELNTFREDPITENEKFSPRFLDFYNRMHDEYGLIIANLEYIDEEYPGGSPLILNTGVVNDNYIDFTKDVYAPDGSKITSADLKSGFYNFLVPENYDTSIHSSYFADIYPADKINYIRYSADSRFFTFHNETCVDDNGYCSNVILEVFDPELSHENDSCKTFTAFMSSYYSNSMFFRYDRNSELTAYEQILPILTETGIDAVTVTSVPVSTQFIKSLITLRNNMIYFIIQSVIFICSFLILLVYSTELYYQNNSKDIALKNISGYSFIEIFGTRIILKTFLLPVMILAGIFLKISPVVAAGCTVFEIVIFYFLIISSSNKNIVNTLKGE